MSNIARVILNKIKTVMRKVKLSWQAKPKSGRKKLLTISLIGVVAVFLIITWLREPDLGYDYDKRLFQGYADGIDGELDETVWGAPELSNDYLRMKWNRAWAEAAAENWQNPPYKQAKLIGKWNGRTPEGTERVWDYKIRWVGQCGSEGAIREDESFCIWDDYAVYMSDYTTISGQFWDAHALKVPVGLD